MRAPGYRLPEIHDEFAARRIKAWRARVDSVVALLRAEA
jgi:hypothetical protein